MAKTPEEMLEEQLSSLTPEELEEYEQELLKAQKPQYAPSVEQMEEAKAAVEPTTGEALAAGVVEGIPFLKDAVSAYDGMADAVEDDNFSMEQAYANYKENLDETNKDLNNVREQAPYTMAAGEIAGTAATLATGAAALRGAGAAKTLTPYGINVASAIGTGAAQQLSRSQDRGFEDVVVGGTVGGLAEVGGQYLVRGVKKGGRYLMDKTDDINATSIKRIFGMDTVSSKRQFAKHLERTNQKESEFLGDVLTQKLDDTMVVKFSDTPERMVSKINVRQNQLGEDLAKMYKQVDAEYKVDIDLEDLKSSLSDDVAAPFLQSDDPGMQQIGSELDQYIQSIGRKVKGVKREVTPEGTKLIEDVNYQDTWNLTRVWKLQKDIRKRIETIYKKNGLDLNASKEQQRQVATSLGRHMDEVLDSVSNEADDVIGMIKNTRKQYGNLSQVKESVESKMFRSQDDPMQVLKESIGFRSLFISGAATSAFGPAGMIAGPVGVRIINSPKTPLYLSEGLKSIANVVSAAPTGSIASRLNTAAIMNNDKFSDYVYGSIAEINMSQNPLPRSAEQIRLRADDVRHYLKMELPTQVAGFDEALESNSDAVLNAYMDQISRSPGANKFFQPGVGFDGIVYSEEDKQQLELQLKEANIPGAQRIQMLNALRKNGIVPNMDQAVQAQPKRHVPRTKKIQDY